MQSVLFFFVLCNSFAYSHSDSRDLELQDCQKNYFMISSLLTLTWCWIFQMNESIRCRKMSLFNDHLTSHQISMTHDQRLSMFCPVFSVCCYSFDDLSSCREEKLYKWNMILLMILVSDSDTRILNQTLAQHAVQWLMIVKDRQLLLCPQVM